MVQTGKRTNFLNFHVQNFLKSIRLGFLWHSQGERQVQLNVLIVLIKESCFDSSQETK